MLPQISESNPPLPLLYAAGLHKQGLKQTHGAKQLVHASTLCSTFIMQALPLLLLVLFFLFAGSIGTPFDQGVSDELGISTEGVGDPHNKSDEIIDNGAHLIICLAMY